MERGLGGTRTIWLASYPMSGNTWLRKLIANLSAKDGPADINHPLAFCGRLATEDEIHRAVRFADFEELRKQERDIGFREAPRPAAGGTFFRRGVAGGWRDELTAQQTERIEAAHAPVMLRLGYSLSEASDVAGVASPAQWHE